MIAVVSQAWTLDADGHADGYLEAYRAFLGFHRQHGGFIARHLFRGMQDPAHFTNVRYFTEVSAYEELIQMAGYADHIEAMGAHLDLEHLPPKEYVELVVSDGPANVAMPTPL